MILVSFPLKVSQKEDISVGLSNQQLTFRTRIIFNLESGDVHKYINFRSLKTCRFDDYKKNRG